jgi:trans-2-enoyl-CoA reductase-like protein
LEGPVEGVLAAMSCEVIELHSRGFIGANAHPEGCRRAVERQIAWVKDRAGAGWEGPRSVLVIGASTGYGLATRIVAAWGFHAATLGVFLERLPGNKRTASPGFYNTVAFHDCARKDGLLAACVNRDAFSRETKNQAVEIIRRTMPPLDLVIYSLAAPRRIDPESGHVHNAAIKPIGCAFTEKAIDIDSEEVVSIKIPPADEEEIADTISAVCSRRMPALLPILTWDRNTVGQSTNMEPLVARRSTWKTPRAVSKHCCRRSSAAMHGYHSIKPSYRSRRLSFRSRRSI